MLENKSDLNKLKVNLLHEEKCKKEIFSDATELDSTAVPMLLQTST